MADDLKVSWYEVNLSTIQVDAATNAWHAGHVNYILPRRDAALVRTSTGGIWLVADNAAAVVLTDLDDPTSLVWCKDRTVPTTTLHRAARRPMPRRRVGCTRRMSPSRSRSTHGTPSPRSPVLLKG
jgi:hypothetical protein